MRTASMTGQNLGFIAFVKAGGNEHITFTHFMIHREALVVVYRYIILDLQPICNHNARN